MAWRAEGLREIYLLSVTCLCVLCGEFGLFTKSTQFISISDMCRSDDLAYHDIAGQAPNRMVAGRPHLVYVTLLGLKINTYYVSWVIGFSVQVSERTLLTPETFPNHSVYNEKGLSPKCGYPGNDRQFSLNTRYRDDWPDFITLHRSKKIATYKTYLSGEGREVQKSIPRVCSDRSLLQTPQILPDASPCRQIH